MLCVIFNVYVSAIKFRVINCLGMNRVKMSFWGVSEFHIVNSQPIIFASNFPNYNTIHDRLRSRQNQKLKNLERRKIRICDIEDEEPCPSRKIQDGADNAICALDIVVLSQN